MNSIIINILIGFVLIGTIKQENACFSKEEMKKINRFVKKDLDKSLDKKFKIKEYIISNDSCCGLYFLKGKVKEEDLRYLIPVLRSNESLIINNQFRMGKAMGVDTVFIRKELEKFINNNSNKFSSAKLDSIQSIFIYGVQFEPLYRVHWKN